MTVYIVMYESEFGGDYTSYVDSVFSTEEAANEYVLSQRHPNRYDIEQYEVK